MSEGQLATGTTYATRIVNGCWANAAPAINDASTHSKLRMVPPPRWCFILNARRRRRLRMPGEEPRAHARHEAHEHIACDRDLDDAGEDARRIGKARRRDHRAAQAHAAELHLRDDAHDERDRQRDLQPGHDL